MRILALDPGHTTGYCVITVNEKTAKLVNVGESKDMLLNDLDGEFGHPDLTAIICEDFLIDPNKSRGGSFDQSRMPTIQTIGIVKLKAQQNQVKCVMQQNNIKPAGYGFAGLTYRRGARGVHQQDAIAHGMYYLVRNKFALPLKSRA